MGKVANARGESKKLARASAGDVVFAGLDVHKRTVCIAVMVNGEIVKTWTVPYDVTAVGRSLEAYRPGLRGIVYEAGVTGFSLARALKAAGYPATVVAPSLTPRRAGECSKSDRLDSRKLVEYFSKGMLRAVAIPTEEQEADRQVMRLRDQCQRNVRRIKQQIKSFLLQHGIAEPKGLKDWSKASIEALRNLRLSEMLRFCLDRMLEAMKHLQEELAAIVAQLRALARTPRCSKAVEALDEHPGVGPITAMAVALELFDPRRFKRPDEVASYTGLAPRIAQSGEDRHAGKIFKTGRGELRALLIEAAWRWVDKDPHARTVFKRLARNTGCAQKAIVGMARQLSIRLWKRLLVATAA
jgi:transposase